MLIKRLVLSLMIALLTVLMPSYPAHAIATRTETGQQISNNDARAIIADNAALIAEVEAVRSSLASERKSTAEIIAELNRYTAASEEEKRLLREQNNILSHMNDVLQKKVTAEKQKSIGKILLGLVVGGVVGATITK